MMRADEETIAAIKRARMAKGFTQSELGQRVGVPQSHISKIEKGDVDIKLSSLIQIARALDLEVKLVPKKALPAVESIVRALPRDKMAAALSEIRKTKTLLDRLDVPNISEDTVEGLRAISHELEALTTVRFGADAFPRLHRVLEQVRKITVRLDPLDTPGGTRDWGTSQTRELARSADDLKKLRRDLAQLTAPEDPMDLPAYSLDDDDD